MTATVERSGRATPSLPAAPAPDVALVVLLVLAACEPANTPLRWLSDDPAARWWFLIPLWGFALLVGLVDDRGLRAAVRTPARWLLLTGIWMMVVSPVGLVPHLDLATATGFTAYVLAGAAVVDAGGWPRLRAALFPASAVLLVASTLTELSGIGGSRWFGVFRDPNALAFGCVVAALCGVDRWMRGGRHGLLLAAAALPVLVLTDGRIAMAALAVGLAALVRPALPRMILPLVIIAVCTGVVLLVANDSLGERASRTVSRTGASEEIRTLTGRTEIWRIALDEVRDRPITGVGAGSTPEMFAVAEEQDRIGFVVTHGHDLWVQLALSGGVVAVALVLLGSIDFAIRARIRPIRDRDALMLALLVHGITEDVMAEPRYTVIIAAAAFATTVPRSARLRQLRRRRSRPSSP
jgi:O-antigen ligase